MTINEPGNNSSLTQTGETKSPPVNKGHHHMYLTYAASIINSYKGNEPFHLYLKKYFSLNKKHGSKDRKLISSLCYNYFRLGFGVSKQMGITEKLLITSFLYETSSFTLPDFFYPAWNASIQLSFHEKLRIAGKEFDAAKIFPFAGELSNEINYEQFNLSFLIQPKLFIRIRPGMSDRVLNKIKNAGFLFDNPGGDCLAFSNNEKVSTVLEMDKEAVVQDYNSQRTLDVAKQAIAGWQPGITVWDCCAGSGGKSILAADIFANCQLTVSDKRKNILENLKLRFGKAGISNYTLLVADLQVPLSTPVFQSAPVDLIIADVPCTGSGTWARTPEQLTFFNKKDIDFYAGLQKKILQNAIAHLGDMACLLYITCSVFKKENEEIVAFIQQKFQLNLIKMEYLKGYEMQADTLFVALFSK